MSVKLFSRDRVLVYTSRVRRVASNFREDSVRFSVFLLRLMDFSGRPLFSELFGIESKMRLESESRRGDASGQVRGIRVAGRVIAHQRPVFHGSHPGSLVS